MHLFLIDLTIKGHNNFHADRANYQQIVRYISHLLALQWFDCPHVQNFIHVKCMREMFELAPGALNFFTLTGGMLNWEERLFESIISCPYSNIKTNI